MNNRMRVGDLQWMFQQYFPYLKLEFFNTPVNWRANVRDVFNYHPSFRLSKLTARPLEQKLLEIEPSEKTGSVEEKFYHDFGLNVQVYRRFGDSWVRTEGSDEVNLSEQNELGKLSAERDRNLWLEREKLL